MSKPNCSSCNCSLEGRSIHYHGYLTLCSHCKIYKLETVIKRLSKEVTTKEDLLDEVSSRNRKIYHEAVKAWEKQEFGEQEEVKA